MDGLITMYVIVVLGLVILSVFSGPKDGDAV